MPGRKKIRGRGRAGKPTTQMGQALQQFWYPAKQQLDFNALAAGGDAGFLVVDHNAEFASSVVKFRKLTLRWCFEAEDWSVFKARQLLVAVYKQDQDDSGTPLELDSEEQIREMRESNMMLRGPWWISTLELATEGFIPPMAVLLKPIILKNLVLEREEDLVLSFTNDSDSAFTAASMKINLRRMGYYRKMPV